MTDHLERARAVVHEYVARPGFIGAFLFGSLSRPYADEHSDIDAEVVFEDDALETVPRGERHVVIGEGARKGADVWLSSRSDLEAKTLDQHRRRNATAIVLFDTNGELASLLARLSEMTESIRQDRLRVHFYEVAFLAQKLQSAHKRHAEACVTRLLAAQLVLAAAKLLFVERREWPASISWTFQELTLSGVPADLVDQLRKVADAADPSSSRVLRAKIHQQLTLGGARFPDDPRGLLEWLWLTAEGKRAWREWGGDGANIGF